MQLNRVFKSQLFNLLGILYDVIDLAATTERVLLDSLGETEDTLADLDALSTVRQEAQDGFRGLSAAMNTLATLDNKQASDNIRVLQQAFERLQQRVAAFERSIEEIRIARELS